DENFEKKCERLKKKFAPLSPTERYAALIELGRKLPPYPDFLKTPDRLVPGCQSALYLSTTSIDNKLYFAVHSEALISSGLAALLSEVYSNETAQTILTCPPTFINDLGLTASLSPTRSNGLAHIHLRLKQEALKFLTTHKTFS